LLVLVGPSGAGKSTLARGLVGAGLVELHRTWTTRPTRADEDSSLDDHVFVDPAAFSAAHAAGTLVVVVELFGHRYGLPALPDDGSDRPLLLLGRTPLLPLLGPLHAHPLVYAVTASAPTLRARRRARGLPDGEQSARDAYDREELATQATRVFDTTAAGADELLDQVATALREDLTARALLEVTP
jgi:ribose 1,5-bisphosphokinase PhnN